MPGKDMHREALVNFGWTVCGGQLEMESAMRAALQASCEHLVCPLPQRLMNTSLRLAHLTSWL